MRQGIFTTPINANSRIQKQIPCSSVLEDSCPLLLQDAVKLCQSELIGGNFENKEFEINLFEMVANTVVDHSRYWLKNNHISTWSVESGMLELSLQCSWARLSACTRFYFWYQPVRIHLGELRRKAVSKACWQGMHCFMIECICET